MMNRTKITLTNDFHNRSVNLVATDGRLTEAQERRARKALCGSPTCQCSGLFGKRGGQVVGIVALGNGNGYRVVPAYRGEV